ncbi:cobalamin B12-binding domain-containing protein [Lichenicoccus roseus]|uniref:Cobalamin B12-binding domain-containing protein n=1 Tax=Lichenicoccus roseus TaxID=2683649 RepID=A0A5R9J909_9PROT|nr:cobalamin-dependent protein [Lichenicoccus roseus]TLU74075.1 cobalamin B12-binding domain-containing protein [Lichenicoccus roseus]
MVQPAFATREAVLRLIQGDIVPRLAEVYRDRQQRSGGRRKAAGATAPVAAKSPSPVSPHLDAPGPEAIVTLALDAMRQDEAAVDQHVRTALASGLDAENILLDLLAPAARYLGELWLEDRATILDVTLGVMRLQARMQILLSTVTAQPVRASHEHSIALWAVPGSKHRFGVAMLAEVFRLRGWNVTLGQIEDPFEIATVLRSDNYDIAGFSLGSVEHAYRLEACIQAARLTSRNRDVIVMAGGPAFQSDTTLATSLDVDAIAENAEDALLRADMLLRRRAAQAAAAMPRLGTLAASPGVVGWSG